MRRLFNNIERLLDILSAMLVAVCLVAVTIQVVMRYVFDQATTWSDTVAACALAWMTFLAATAAVRRDENLVVRIMWTKLGPTGKKIIATICHLIVLLISITNNAQVEGLVFEVTWAQFYSVSLISAVLMILFSLEHIASLWIAGARR